jgi:hypothetical protein
MKGLVVSGARGAFLAAAVYQLLDITAGPPSRPNVAKYGHV